jgi:hypothetical protein
VVDLSRVLQRIYLVFKISQIGDVFNPQSFPIEFDPFLGMVIKRTNEDERTDERTRTRTMAVGSSVT